MGALGEHKFVRRCNERLPVHKLSGPAIEAKMFKERSKAAFERTVATELPARLMIEVNAVVADRAPGD